MKKKRVAVLGLDGVPFGLMEELLDSGVMPRLTERTDRGSLRRMRSAIPPISSVAWSSFMTGMPPGRHGIFGFTDLAPGMRKLALPSFDDLQCPPIWQDLPGKRTIVVNLPFTYPARPLNGAIVCGFVAPLLERAAWPESLIPWLKSMGYRFDVDAVRGRTDRHGLMDDLFTTLRLHFEAMYAMMDSGPWDLFIGVVTGTDRLHHFFFDAYLERDHPFRDEFFAYYRRVDAMAGELFDRIGSETRLILLSDHGFTGLKTQVYVNHFLKRLGYLSLQTASPSSVEHVSRDSRAFALDPGRIYLNSRSRFLDGTLDRTASLEISAKLKTDLSRLTVSDLGGLPQDDGVAADTPIFREVLTGEEAYGPDRLPSAPDLVLVPTHGFDLKAAFQVDAPFMNDIFTGTHTGDDAFLLTDDSSIAACREDLEIADVASLIKEVLA